MTSIFVSWSGRQGKGLAEALKETILDLRNVDAWVSSQDIAFGSAWFKSLDSELKSADGALVCVTSDAINSPWVYFEIGALWARLGNVKAILFGVDEAVLRQGPLSQIQLARAISKEDVSRILLEFFAQDDKERIGRHINRTWQEWIKQVREITDPLGSGVGVDSSVVSLSRALLDSFEAQSRHFKVFEFKLLSELSRPELAEDGFPFDLILNGFLKMRSDDPPPVGQPTMLPLCLR